MDPKVLIISDDADEFAKLIHAGAPSIDVTVAHGVTEAEAGYSEHRILFGRPDHIAAVLPGMPTVEWVQSMWAGVTPLVQLNRRDYVLTCVKGVFGPQIADYVTGYLLAHELRLIRRLEEQRAHRWWPGESGAPEGKRLGIMGTGSIGRAIAERARSLDVSVWGLSRSGTESPEFDCVFPLDHLAEFLSNLDYLVSILPDTRATDRLLNSETLAHLPSHAYFINVGRGNVVDDAALIDALKSGRLAGAVLDVFNEEPVPQDSRLWDTPNLLMTGHMAATSRPKLIAPIFLENYRRFVSGRRLNFVVSFEHGY